MREKIGLSPQEVLKLLKGAYGRVDAPYLWFMELKKGLEQVGFTQSPFDPCAFVLTHPVTQKTEGILGIHVDDGLCCGSGYFETKLQELAKRFPFGSHKKRNFTFTGLRIEQQNDFSIHVHQTQYIEDIQSASHGKEEANRHWLGIGETISPSPHRFVTVYGGEHQTRLVFEVQLATE